jgi:hypothetical protein
MDMGGYSVISRLSKADLFLQVQQQLEISKQAISKSKSIIEQSQKQIELFKAEGEFYMFYLNINKLLK